MHEFESISDFYFKDGSPITNIYHNKYRNIWRNIKAPPKKNITKVGKTNLKCLPEANKFHWKCQCTSDLLFLTLYFN